MDKIVKLENSKKRVLLGMSGGVDSSVAALLLKQQGYEVIGVFYKLWHPKSYRENSCCNLESVETAREVCDLIGIDFYVFDAKKEFKKDVVDDFIFQYSQGRTPNPCVVCNNKIKFGWFIDKMKKLNCDFVATGHYVRSKVVSNKYKLFMAKDVRKDQSYFLWQLSQDQIKYALFPLGKYHKQDVRKIAQKHNLPVYDKSDSQDVCFVQDDVASFLGEYIEASYDKGDVVYVDKTIIGKHNGLFDYTIGQRSKISNIKYHKIADDIDKRNVPPLYVVKIDRDKNQLVLGLDSHLYGSKLYAKQINILNHDAICKNIDLRAKIRSNAKLANCEIKFIAKDKLEVFFKKPQRAITPGQSIVFYKQEELIGGGVIV
jgi:tRNA-specific 2-thiouridylase